MYDAALTDVVALMYELQNEKTVGYMIIDPYRNLVLEFSAADQNPYSKIAVPADDESAASCKRVYTYADYGVSISGNKIQFLLGGERSVVVESRRSAYASTANMAAGTAAVPVISTNTVSGFTYYLQNSRNCVAAAMAHMITFWNRFCPSLCNVTNQTSFNALMDSLTAYGNNYGGIGVNANIPSVYQAYVNGLIIDPLPGGIEYSYSVTAQNIWNPTVSQVIAEINAGRPVMLGYTQWVSAPHMTVCTGIEYRSGSYYVTVASGHSTSPTEKIWDSSVNDFICRVSFTVDSLRSISDISAD